MIRLFKRRPARASFPLMAVIPYVARPGELASTFIFTEPAGGTYTKLKVLDAFGSEVPYGPVA